MIVLDYQDRRPIYEQVTDKFQILILNGVLPPGSQMPSVRQLATELSVNPNTIENKYFVPVIPQKQFFRFLLPL